MDEKTKNRLSCVLSILIVGGLTTCFVIAPRISLTWFFDVVLAVLCLFILIFIAGWLKGLLYDFFSSSFF